MAKLILERALPQSFRFGADGSEVNPKTYIGTSSRMIFSEKCTEAEKFK